MVSCWEGVRRNFSTCNHFRYALDIGLPPSLCLTVPQSGADVRKCEQLDTRPYLGGQVQLDRLGLLEQVVQHGRSHLTSSLHVLDAVLCFGRPCLPAPDEGLQRAFVQKCVHSVVFGVLRETRP